MKTKKQRQKIYGGLADSKKEILSLFALKIKNKIYIDPLEFKKELDSIENPLKILMRFDGMSSPEYTINEYAFIHNVPNDIHAVFLNYDVDLLHTVYYPEDSALACTIFEAYLLYTDYFSNINAIINQIEKSKEYDCLFRYESPDYIVPTVLDFAQIASKFTQNTYKSIIFPTVMNLYIRPEILPTLTNNGDTHKMAMLLLYAINNSNIHFILYLTATMPDKNALLQIMFSTHVISAAIIHGTDELYETIINILNSYDDSIIEYVICEIMKSKKKCTNESIQKFMGLYKNKKYAPFFEYVGKYAIKNLMIPSLSKNPKIIIVCHGTSLGNEEKNYGFPFLKCCFFVDKGNILQEMCIFSKSVEELICAGNYDSNLTCIESDKNGNISMENMIFSFSPTTWVHKKNETLGFYLCLDNKVIKMKIKPDVNKYYNVEDLIHECETICAKTGIDENEIIINIFSCRKYMGNERKPQLVNILPIGSYSITP